jgi:hypothetical protein
VDPGERFAIDLLARAGAGAVAIVSLGDEPELLVRASGADVTFASEVDGLVVGGVGAGSRVEIRVPRASPSIEIRVAGRRVLLARRGQIVSDAAPVGGSWRVPLGAPQR